MAAWRNQARNNWRPSASWHGLGSKRQHQSSGSVSGDNKHSGAYQRALMRRISGN